LGSASAGLRPGAEQAFDFLNRPENWPKWAIVNMKSVKPAADRWYDTETRQGQGQLKMLSTSRSACWIMFGKTLRRRGQFRRGLFETATALHPHDVFQPPVLDDNAFDGHRPSWLACRHVEDLNRDHLPLRRA
jgi:hypothetical protein